MRLKIDGSIKPLWQQLKQQPALMWVLSALWLVAVNGLAFVWHLGSTGLVDETEPLFAEAARQMTVTDDWVTPYFNGNTRFDKPPLVYWLMAIAYRLIGVNEWAVRLPSALAAIALTVFCFFTLRYFSAPIAPGEPLQPPHKVLESRSLEQYQWLAAWIGAALAALNLQTILWARTGVSDMLLSGCMGLALLAFFWGYVQPSGSPAKPRWYLTCYVLIALAILTKGPVGIVLPALIVGAFLLYLGNGKAVLAEMMPWRGLLIILLLALPWYILVTLANGEAFIDSFFGYHNFERFTRAVNNHRAVWFFYVGVVLAGFAPWSLYLPVAIARLHFWNWAYWRQQPRSAHLRLFALIWFAVIFGFFTIAKTKLPSYTLPLLPAAAILVGLLWSDQMSQFTKNRSKNHSINSSSRFSSPNQQLSGSLGMWISNSAAVLFWLALSIAISQSAEWMGGDPAMPNFPDIIQRSGILTIGSLVCAIAAAVQVVFLLRHQGQWLWLVNLLALSAFIIFTVMPFSSLIDAQRQLPLRQIAATVVQEQRPREEIVMVGFSKPSMTFYTQEKVTYLVHAADMAKRLRRPYRARRSVLILGLPRKLAELDLQPDQYQILNQAGAYELIRVELPLQ